MVWNPWPTSGCVGPLWPLSCARQGITVQYHPPIPQFHCLTYHYSSSSFQSAIDFAKSQDFDAYLAIGGGSVMDTCKAANLYASKPDAEFLDYVNPPIGKGLPVTHQVKPLIAGTYPSVQHFLSWCSIIFYLSIYSSSPNYCWNRKWNNWYSYFWLWAPESQNWWDLHSCISPFPLTNLPIVNHPLVGISNRAIRPLLGIVDPLHTLTMPNRVAAYSGFDVLWLAIDPSALTSIH